MLTPAAITKCKRAIRKYPLSREKIVAFIVAFLLALYLAKRIFLYMEEDFELEWDGILEPFVLPEPLFISEISAAKGGGRQQQETIGGGVTSKKEESGEGAVLDVIAKNNLESLSSKDANGLERSKEDILIKPARPFTSSSKTLVTMAYCEISPVYIENLDYFIQVAISEDENVDYILVVNGHQCKPCEIHAKKLDALRNVRIIYRINSGFDFGAFSDVLSLHVDDVSLYGNFIFLNGGVRGPVVPYYSIGGIRNWHQAFTSKLNDRVALVGPSVSCEVQIHVQSHFFVLNQKGLSAVWNAGVFISNGTNINQIVRHSEFGLTDAVFGAGLTIDTIMLEYQMKDWRSLYYDLENEKGEDQCNYGLNPLREMAYGLDRDNTYSLSPFELMFTKRAGSVRKLCAKKGPGKKFGEKRICYTDSLIDDASEFILATLGLTPYSKRSSVI